MKFRNNVFIVFVIIFLYFFFIYDIDFRGPDEPIYSAYTASIIENGDLNVVNEAYPTSSRLRLSKTYNLPDFHNHGGIILWAPFYIYAKSAYYAASKLNFLGLGNYGQDKFTSCALSFSTIAFALLILLLSYYLSRIFFTHRISLFSVLTIFLGTPFFYYALFETGNANIIACLFSVISIWFCSYALAMKKSHWFLYGLFFSICITIKTELWSHLLFIIPFFVILVILKKVNLRNGIYFIVGVLPISALRAVNSYIKYGTLHTEEIFYLSSAFRYKATYCFNGLFSSYRGIFYTSPVFYICLLGLIFCVICASKNIRVQNKEKIIQDIFLLLLALYSAVKLFFVGRVFSPGGDTLSARILLTEFPVFILLFARAFCCQRKYIKYFLSLISGLFIFWNLLIISEYMAGLDWAYITGAPPVLERLGAIKYIFDPLFHSKDLHLKLKLCLPLLFIIAGIIFYITRKSLEPVNHFSSWGGINRKRSKFFNMLMIFTVYSSIAYFGFTSLNMANNKVNTEKLEKRGLLLNAKIIETFPLEMNEVEEDEHLWTLYEMMRYYALKGDIDMLNYIKKYKEKIFGKRESIRIHFYQPVKAYYNLANAYNNKGRYEKAIDCYEKLIQFNPDDSDAFINLGYLYLSLSDYRKAKEAFERVIQLNPESIDAYFRLGEIYVRVCDYALAKEYYQKSLELNPRSPDAYSALASIYNRQEDYTNAIDYYQKYLKLNPKSADMYSALGSIYNRQGDYALAKEYYQKSLELNPRSPDAYSALASIYNRQEDYTNAIDYYQKYLKLNPKSADMYSALGSIYNRQGDYALAKEYYQKSLELNPRSPDAYSALASIYNRQEDYTNAIDYYQKYLKLNPKSADMYSALGSIYNRQGDYALAKEYYQKSLELNPRSPDAYSALASIYNRQEDYTNAIDYYQKYLKLNPKSADMYSALGSIYNRQGDYALAKEYYQKSLELNPRSPDAYSALMDVYKKINDKKNAFQLIKRLRELKMNDLADVLEKSVIE